MKYGLRPCRLRPFGGVVYEGFLVAQTDLVALLDPHRDYGERTFEQIKEGIARGLILIEPGHTIPVLRDPATHRSIKGTGRPPGVGDVKVSRAYIERRFSNNKKAIWDALYKGAVTDGDPRWGKLLLEYGLGKPVENASGFSEGVMLLLQQLAAGQNTRTETVREVIFEQAPK